MKTIGLLGGMSWESTALYYRWLNEGIREKLGGLHSAKVAMVSVDFQEIEHLQHVGNWDEAGKQLAIAARQIEAAGADFLLVCTNTMHKIAPQIEEAIAIPLLHIADATAESIKARGIQSIGLLGTQFTMEQDFYRGRLSEKHGLNVIVPNESDRHIVHRIIYDELCVGVVKSESRQEYVRIIKQMQEAGAEGAIAGCTEITMLIQQQHVQMPLFDTTAIHARAAVELALNVGPT
ncbi:MAG: aspartate/glutamate racemase family protein [Cyanobacteria bacterium J06642_2]